MNTIEEFENAPVGATATGPDGSIAFKTGRPAFEWKMFDAYWSHCDNRRSDELAGYTLTPAAPTTSREALDLAWELAHEVKEGQTIPGGVRTIGRYEDGDFFLGRSLTDRLVTGSEESHLRTQEPLPDPEPDWLDAPAVLARHKDWDKKSDLKVFERTSNGLWIWDHFVRAEAWDLRDVTPLYPKGKKE